MGILKESEDCGVARPGRPGCKERTLARALPTVGAEGACRTNETITGCWLRMFFSARSPRAKSLLPHGGEGNCKLEIRN